jgi:uncharacterized protein YndB with AHSA1/START domain
MDEYGVFTGPSEVRFERLLPGPIERVWAYLTEPGKRRTWFAGGPIEPRVGGKVEFFFQHSNLNWRKEPVPEKYNAAETGVGMTFRVTRYEPPHVLGYTWDEQGSEVTFELAAQGDKVLLVLTHRRLPDRAALANVSSGWHLHLGLLEDLLAGKETRPFWSNQARLEAEYAQRTPS